MRSNTLPSHADSRVYVSLKELIALRSQVKYQSLLQQHKVQQHLPGDNQSNRLGQGIEFSEIRTYQPGDDIRSIDWRALARSGRAYSRLFTEERERHMHIALDQRAPMFFGSQIQFKSVLAAKMAAAAVWFALAEGFRISAQLSAETEWLTKASSTRKAAITLLNDIVTQNLTLSVQSEKTRSLADMLTTCIGNTKSGSQITLISDFHDLDSAAIELLTATSQHRKMHLIMIFDPIEKVLPVRRAIGISDGWQRQRMPISRLVRNQQTDTFKRNLDTLQQLSHTAGATLRVASTHDLELEYSGQSGRHV